MKFLTCSLALLPFTVSLFGCYGIRPSSGGADAAEDFGDIETTGKSTGSTSGSVAIRKILKERR